MDRYYPLYFLGVLPDPPVWHHVFRFCRPFLLDKSDPSL